MQPNEGELSEGVGGTFGRLTLFDTAPDQGLLDCTHSKAGKFKRRGNGSLGGGGVT